MALFTIRQTLLFTTKSVMKHLLNYKSKHYESAILK